MSTANLIETLFRHGIGYDQIARFPDVFSNVTNYPPHNIEKLDEDNYRLTLAVAGFVRTDINVSLHQGTLTIEGKKPVPSSSEDGEMLPAPSASGDKVNPPSKMLYRGIGFRDFSRQFKLGEHVNIISATLENGLLVIDMERRLPEELQPKQIVVQ